LLDLREWQRYVDFAFAAEKDSNELRDLKFNARRHFPPGYVQAIGLTIEQVLTKAPEGWLDIIDKFEQWPCLVNYDVYQNPAVPTWKTFQPNSGFWKGVRNYLHAVQDSVPGILLMVTSNLRGKAPDYNSALDEMFRDLRDYGCTVSEEVERRFLDGPMPKKCQICIPFWLSRFAALVELFKVEILESVDYVGTSNVHMMHMVLKLKPTSDPARASEITLTRLVNFPHHTLVRAMDGTFSRVPTDYPVVKAGQDSGGP